MGHSKKYVKHWLDNILIKFILPSMQKKSASANRHPTVVDVFKVYGSATKLAKALGVSRQAVSAWKFIPFRHLLQVSHETGMPRERLRPDIFG